jgi:hypothetical protein
MRKRQFHDRRRCGSWCRWLRLFASLRITIIVFRWSRGESQRRPLGWRHSRRMYKFLGRKCFLVVVGQLGH